MRLTPQQAVYELQRRKAKRESDARLVLAQTAQEALEQAIRWSSGTYSLGQLAAMGHPYAKPVATLPPHIINVQSGSFLRHWRIEWTGPLSVRVINDDPKVPLLKSGKGAMVVRTIEEELRAFARPHFERRMNALKARQ